MPNFDINEIVDSVIYDTIEVDDFFEFRPQNYIDCKVNNFLNILHMNIRSIKKP